MWVNFPLGGVFFFYMQMFSSTTLIGVSIFTLGGEFWSYLSYLFYTFISVVSTILLYHVCGGWFTDGWLGQGCWYLWLSAKVSFLHLGVVLYYFIYFIFH